MDYIFNVLHKTGYFQSSILFLELFLSPLQLLEKSSSIARRGHLEINKKVWTNELYQK